MDRGLLELSPLGEMLEGTSRVEMLNSSRWDRRKLSVKVENMLRTTTHSRSPQTPTRSPLWNQQRPKICEGYGFGAHQELESLGMPETTTPTSISSLSQDGLTGTRVRRLSFQTITITPAQVTCSKSGVTITSVRENTKEVPSLYNMTGLLSRATKVLTTSMKKTDP